MQSDDYELLCGSNRGGGSSAMEREPPERGVQVDGRAQDDEQDGGQQNPCRAGIWAAIMESPGNVDGNGAGDEDGENHRLQKSPHPAGLYDGFLYSVAHLMQCGIE